MNIESLLQKTDLRSLVEKAGGKINKNRCACPLHGGKDTNAFAIYKGNDGREMWKCFSGDCGGGDVITFVEKWRGYDFKQACEFLGGDVHADPVEMERLARERVERAKVELEQKQNAYEAALKELQFAQKHLHYHDTMKEWAREMWVARGIDEGLQDFWTLGACEDFTINGDYHTPTLTIPIFSESRDLLNIKHRLINPQKPNDKYRPEKSGLGPFPPFLAIPEMGYDGDLIVVVEGEIKAMVTWATVSGIDVQTIGIPGRSQFKSIADKVKGKNVVVIPDPGAEKDAYDFAKSIQARYLPMPSKVDDYILETGISSDNFYSLIKQSRRA
jgi:hypothetical protein